MDDETQWSDLNMKIITPPTNRLRKLKTGVWFYDDNGLEVTRYHMAVSLGDEERGAR